MLCVESYCLGGGEGGREEGGMLPQLKFVAGGPKRGWKLVTIGQFPLHVILHLCLCSSWNY